MTGIAEMKRYNSLLFLTYSQCSKPGGREQVLAEIEYVEYLSRCAVSIIDALFLETHPNPDNALSDGPNMVKLDDLDEILKRLLEIDNIVKAFQNIWGDTFEFN